MKLSSLTRYEHVYRRSESIWWINDQIKKGRIQATYEEVSEVPTQDQIDATILKFLDTKGGVLYRIGAKELIDGGLAIHFPLHIQIALWFLNDKIKFMGKELMDFDDAGIYEDVHIEIYVLPMSSERDHTLIA